MLKNNIARELQKEGKSQNWLADLTGISKGMISQIVSGRSIPTPDELSMICGAAGWRREQLYGPDGLQLILGTEPKPTRKRNTKPVRITNSIIEEIDKYAKKYDLSRDEACRSLIMSGVMAQMYHGGPQGYLEIKGGEERCRSLPWPNRRT